jgi:hypothetical protein
VTAGVVVVLFECVSLPVCVGVGGGRCVDRYWLDRHIHRHALLAAIQELPVLSGVRARSWQRQYF